MIFSFSAEIVGLTAAACTTVSYVPQAILVIRKKETRDISLGMYVVLAIGVVAWAVYGFMLHSISLILCNIVTLIPVFTILGMKLKYG